MAFKVQRSVVQFQVHSRLGRCQWRTDELIASPLLLDWQAPILVINKNGSNGVDEHIDLVVMRSTNSKTILSLCRNKWLHSSCWWMSWNHRQFLTETLESFVGWLWWWKINDDVVGTLVQEWDILKQCAADEDDVVDLCNPNKMKIYRWRWSWWRRSHWMVAMFKGCRERILIEGRYCGMMG